MPSLKRLAALERAFAGPFESFMNRQADAIRTMRFVLGYLAATGHVDLSVLEGFKGPRFWPLTISLLKGFHDRPGLEEARKHIPQSPAAWQAFDADPEGYLRACAEHDPART